jgi:phosphatidylglycerophosphatase C|uniref:HAD-superfamily hydrolase subfamily IB,PSPase-like n=1 Tax=mine drainage metagenome TaxID=410659 RepID=E6QS33_9ZZZZ
MKNNSPVWAAFDFDGTLTQRDSLLPFLRQVLGAGRLAATLTMQAPWLAAYAVGLLANDRAKARLLRHTLGGMHRSILQEHGKSYATNTLPQLLRPAMMQRLRQHQAQGHTCVLVTASLTLYTQDWGLTAGLTQVIGSELAYDENGLATGALQGKNCYGAEKAVRLRELLPSNAKLYAYGDSRGDLEMLAMADKAWVINQENDYGRKLPELK